MNIYRSIYAVLLMTLMSSTLYAWEAIYDEEKIPEYTLPDPLTMNDGTPVKSADDWTSKRRAEVLDLFKEHVYGRMPPALPIKHAEEHPESDVPLTGKFRLKQNTLYFKEDRSGPAINVAIFLPPEGDGPFPAFMMLNFMGNHTLHSEPSIRMHTGHARKRMERGERSYRWPIETITARGYGVVTACYNDIDVDTKGEGPQFHDGVHVLYPGHTEGENNWATIGAWAWGMSRILDSLEAEELIDAKRVIANGHSRLGKTSLWAGASDERFAAVISNNSGCGGAALARRRYGESVLRINTSFPHWFNRKHKEYNDNEAAMPVDHHMLISLMAPRPVYVASAEGDRWADPKGEFLSCLGADPVYRLFGDGLSSPEFPELNKPNLGKINYHVREGKHDVTGFDWEQFLDFADRHVK